MAAAQRAASEHHRRRSAAVRARRPDHIDVARRLHLSHRPSRRARLRRTTRERRRGRVAPRPTLRGHRIHPGQARAVRRPGDAGANFHRHRRAGHPRSATRAYRPAVMASAEMAVHSRDASAAFHHRTDVDRLLAGYRATRAQDALFDLRPPGLRGPGIGYDEFVDEAGNVRPAWTELADAVGDRGRAGLHRLRSAVHQLVDNDDITYTVVDPGREPVAGGHGVEPRAWHLDPLPLVVSAADWEVLEAGLVQRSRLLNAVLADLYGSRRSLTEGVLPPQLLFAHPGYVRAANGIEVPGHHQLFMHACDVSRLSDGSFQVNADWTQAPSGAGYALADRRVLTQALPDLYERVGPRPTTPFAQALRLALIDAAPDGVQDPVVVVLSPGIYSETSFDQAYLATLLGFPMVESADLVVRDGTLWMRSLGTLKRVDVVFRRVDATYTDPLDLRADSRLGVAGLVEAQHRGTVTVVNTVGSGILESAGLQRFLPELALRLLGESPLLASTPSYWGGIDSERSHLLANL